jgi:hypothetical protein
MATAIQLCPECQADWLDGHTCEEDFHQMLFWESENRANWVVHHLMVLCYHLQHPSLYSPEGLTYSHQLLVDFVEKGISPGEVRQNRKADVASGNRNWKITARPNHHGAYDRSIQWPMTARDVVACGAEHYIESVRVWADSVYETLRGVGVAK